ncbi:MAG: hypothetical protein ABIQ02_08460 [Saprospiraceae bacterium]
MSRNLLLSTICTLFFTACSSSTVIMPRNVAQIHNVQKRTSWSFLWGAIQDKRFENTELTNCEGNGLSMVSVKTNAAFVLLNVISLGTVMPIRIAFDCAKDTQIPPPGQ